MANNMVLKYLHFRILEFPLIKISRFKILDFGEGVPALPYVRQFGFVISLMTTWLASKKAQPSVAALTSLEYMDVLLCPFLTHIFPMSQR